MELKVEDLKQSASRFSASLSEGALGMMRKVRASSASMRAELEAAHAHAQEEAAALAAAERAAASAQTGGLI